MERAIAVRDQVKRYGELVAVGGISFEVKARGISGLLGPNGAGKTTTVGCSEGLRVPDSGEIRVLGEAPSPGNRWLKDRLGIQLQRTAFLPHLTVEETLELIAALCPRHRPIDELLGLFALGEKGNTRVKDLSGGQRLAVAPEILRELPSITRVVATEGRVALYTTDVTATVSALARMAEEGEISLGDIIWRRATLEDVCLLLAGRRLE